MCDRDLEYLNELNIIRSAVGCPVMVCAAKWDFCERMIAAVRRASVNDLTMRKLVFEAELLGLIRDGQVVDLREKAAA